MALETKDFQIIYHLDQNCRQSLTQIAKKVRLHRNVVDYRIKNMEKDGVIRGYYAQINTLALGYVTFRIFINISNATPEVERSLIEYLRNEPRTIWLFRAIGKWEYDVLLVAKSLFEVDAFMEQFQARFNQIIEDKEIAIMTKIYDLPKDYLIGNTARKAGRHVFQPIEVARLSPNESAVLSILSNDARIRSIDLAKKTKLSINTTTKIIKELQKKRVILAFRPFIDTAKSGYEYYKVHINLKQYTAADLSNIKFWLESDPRIISINHLINGDDLEVEAHLKPGTQAEFMQALKKKFGYMIKNSFVIQFTEEFVFRYMPDELVSELKKTGIRRAL